VIHLPEDEGENGFNLRKSLQKEEKKGTSKATKYSAAMATILEQAEDE